MSQIWTIVTINPVTTSPATDIQKMVDAYNALQSNFSGAAEPTGAARVAYSLWADTTTGLLKIRNAANSAWITIGTLASANLGLVSAAGNGLTGGLNEAKTTVASSATPDVFATTVGNLVDYTGTVTCTGFTAAPQAGARRTLLCAGAAPFTAGANMLINGVGSGTTYVCVAGDQVDVVAVTTTQFRLTIRRADGGDATQGVSLVNDQSAAYTLLISDRSKIIRHPASDNTPRTFTIPANASVAYPIGTVIHFVNEINTVTIAITTDTLTLSPGGATGSRTLAGAGLATARKITATAWYISGSGLT